MENKKLLDINVAQFTVEEDVTTRALAFLLEAQKNTFMAPDVEALLIRAIENDFVSRISNVFKTS